MTIARTLLMGSIILPLSATALGRKNETPASSLIEQARHLSDIRSEGAPPFQLRLGFTVMQANGTAAEGVYRETWFSRAQWRREIEVGDFRRIEVGIDRKRWQLDSSASIPVRISEVTHLTEFRSFPGTWKPVKEREINGVDASCIEQQSGSGFLALCFAKANGTVVAERKGTNVCSYANYQMYGDRMFAKSYECAEDDRLTLKARILDLTATPDIDASLFAPPKGGKEFVNCFTPIQPTIALSALSPPPPTESFTGTIVVSVSAAVGSDGRVHNPKVVSEPRLQFDKPAVAAVQEWRFKPASCDGQPIESEVVVQVAFRHY